MTVPYKPMLPSGAWFAEQHAKWWNDPYRSYQHGRRAELDAAGDSGAARPLPAQAGNGQRHKHAPSLGRIPSAQRQRDLHQNQRTVEKQTGSAAENIIERTPADRLDGPSVRPAEGAAAGENEKNSSGGLGVPVPLHADMDGAELQSAPGNIEELRLLSARSCYRCPWCRSAFLTHPKLKAHMYGDCPKKRV